ncbi:MAG: ankyrin repeat domain-containing protein [Armatimonas sp.]
MKIPTAKINPLVTLFCMLICASGIMLYRWIRSDIEEMLPKSANNDDPAFVQLYLDRGENINYIDSHGQSLLIIAIMNRRVDVAKLLLEKGADKNIKYRNMSCYKIAKEQIRVSSNKIEKEKSTRILELLK